MPLEVGIESQAQGNRRTFHTKALIYMKKEQHYYPTYPLQNQRRESLELSLEFNMFDYIRGSCFEVIERD